MEKKNFLEHFKGANPLGNEEFFAWKFSKLDNISNAIFGELLLSYRPARKDAGTWRGQKNHGGASSGPPLPRTIRRPHGRTDLATLRPDLRRLATDCRSVERWVPSSEIAKGQNSMRVFLQRTSGRKWTILHQNKMQHLLQSGTRCPTSTTSRVILQRAFQ